MKKVFVALLFAAAGTIHAEIAMNGLIDMSIVPYQLILNNTTEPAYSGGPEQEAVIMGAGAGRISSSQGPRGRLDLRAFHEDSIGMRMRIQARTDGIGIEDFLQAWWKPLPWLRIDGGRFFDDRLRGKINDLDERMNAYTVRMYDADAIFSRFRTHWTGQAGVMVSLTPPSESLANLWIGALLYGLNPLSSAGAAGILYDAHPDYVADNSDVFRRIQAAVSYTIPDVGLARVQYFGAKQKVDIKRVSDEWVDDNSTIFYSYLFDTFTITAPRMEAAFAFTGVSGLILDIGGKIPFPFREWTNDTDSIFEKEDEALLDPLYKTYKTGYVWQAPFQVSVGVKYTTGEFEFAGRLDTLFLGSMKGNKTEIYFAPQINMHIWPSYKFSFARLILDFGYEWFGAAYDKNKELIGKGSPVAMNGGNRLGAGISVQKNITAGSFVKGGFAFKFAGTVNGVEEKAVFTIPLCLEYSF